MIEVCENLSSNLSLMEWIILTSTCILISLLKVKKGYRITIIGILLHFSLMRPIAPNNEKHFNPTFNPYGLSSYVFSSPNSLANLLPSRPSNKFKNSCAFDAVSDATSGLASRYNIKINEYGLCSTTEDYKVIYDTVNTIVRRRNWGACIDCCVSITNIETDWKGELLLTIHGYNTHYLTCDQLTYHECFVGDNDMTHCKRLE